MQNTEGNLMILKALVVTIDWWWVVSCVSSRCHFLEGVRSKLKYHVWIKATSFKALQTRNNLIQNLYISILRGGYHLWPLECYIQTTIVCGVRWSDSWMEDGVEICCNFGVQCRTRRNSGSTLLPVMVSVG